MIIRQSYIEQTELLPVLRTTLKEISWLIAVYPDYEDSKQWENTLSLICVVNTPTLHIPQHELEKLLAPIENKYRIVFDLLMYFEQNAPQPQAKCVVKKDNFHPTQTAIFTYAADDPINRKKIERHIRLANIWKANPALREETKSRLKWLLDKSQDCEKASLEKWITVLSAYDDEMISILLETGNRRMQTLAISSPIPPRYCQMKKNISQDKLRRCSQIVMQS